MSSYDFWWGFGRGFENILAWFYDNIQDTFNDITILAGLLAMVYWLITLNKLTKKARQNGTIE